MIPWGCLRALPLLSLQISLRLSGHPAQTGINGQPILVAFDLNAHRRAGPHSQKAGNLALSQARIEPVTKGLSAPTFVKALAQNVNHRRLEAKLRPGQSLKRRFEINQPFGRGIGQDARSTGNAKSEVQ